MILQRAATAAGLACAAVAAAGTMLATSATSPRAATAAPPPAPNAVTQPLLDGCQRNPPALFSRQTPEWAYVYNTPAGQPAPAPRWAEGVISSYNPRYAAVHVSGGDLPTGHLAYDYNVVVAPDPQFMYLLGGSKSAQTGDYAGNDESTERLHIEWEDLSVPKFAWAEPGDRITVLGSWVWDCGHWGPGTQVFNPDYVLPHPPFPCTGIVDPNECQVSGESTELHPYRVFWDVRHQTTSGTEGEAQAELFASTDKTRAGIEADCAHQFPPVAAGVVYGADYRLCLETAPAWQDLTGDYSFYLNAPPRPSATAQLVYRAVNQGSSGAPAPHLAAEGDGVRVTFHLDTPAATKPDVTMGYTVFAGWSEVAAAQVPTHLHVRFDRLQVHRAMDPGCSLSAPVPGCQLESTRPNQEGLPPGQWDLYWDVNGIWGQWNRGEFDPSDGQTFTGDQSVDLYVPPAAGWRLFVVGRECDLGGLALALGQSTWKDCPGDRSNIADDNDVPGLILDKYSSALAGLGTHTSNGRTHKDDPTSTCPDGNPQGCYSLTYTVSLVDDGAGRVRTAAAGGPSRALPDTATAAWILVVLLVGAAAGFGTLAGVRKA